MRTPSKYDSKKFARRVKLLRFCLEFRALLVHHNFIAATTSMMLVITKAETKLSCLVYSKSNSSLPPTSFPIRFFFHTYPNIIPRGGLDYHTRALPWTSSRACIILYLRIEVCFRKHKITQNPS